MSINFPFVHLGFVDSNQCFHSFTIPLDQNDDVFLRFELEDFINLSEVWNLIGIVSESVLSASDVEGSVILISVSTQMSVLSVSSFGNNFFVSERIFLVVKLNFKVGWVEAEHFVAAILLKLGKFAEIFMLLLFS